jgi:hypothetical protein
MNTGNTPSKGPNWLTTARPQAEVELSVCGHGEDEFRPLIVGNGGYIGARCAFDKIRLEVRGSDIWAFEIREVRGETNILAPRKLGPRPGWYRREVEVRVGEDHPYVASPHSKLFFVEINREKKSVDVYELAVFCQRGHFYVLGALTNRIPLGRVADNYYFLKGYEWESLLRALRGVGAFKGMDSVKLPSSKKTFRPVEETPELGQGQGFVHKVIPSRGIGYIRDANGNSVRFHWTKVRDRGPNGLGLLPVGSIVTFESHRSERHGTQAKWVELAQPPKCSQSFNQMKQQAPNSSSKGRFNGIEGLEKFKKP